VGINSYLLAIHLGIIWLLHFFWKTFLKYNFIKKIQKI